jgi:hypothetical protein
VCPQGNGYDSIRFWESLSVGAIPIVLNTYFTESLMEQHPEVPFMVLDKWEDLPSFLHSKIDKAYDQFMAMSNLEIVTEEYWLREFARKVETSDETDLPNTREATSLSDTMPSHTESETG